MKRKRNSPAYRLPGFLRSKSGSALVLVICVILLLTMFGTVSLFASFTNLRMSNRSNDWSVEYFASDANLEKVLARIDRLLKNAEEYTGEYMKEQYYKVNELPIGNISNYLFDKQSLIYSHWQADFPYDSYAEYYDTIEKDSEGTPVGAFMSEGEYLDTFKLFNEDMYERLYFYFAHVLIQEDLQSAESGSLYSLIDEEADKNNEVKITANSSITDIFSFAEEFVYNKDNWRIDISSATGNNDIRHTINGVLSIKLPGAETVISTINNPVYGNPLWGYALAAEGDISFNSSATVYGDVLAASKLAGDDIGAVDINTGSNVSVYGNIYANGDVTALGNGAKLTVKAYNTKDSLPVGFSYFRKQKIYGGSSMFINQSDNNLYLHDGSSSAYTEGSTQTGVVPLLYQDYNWGNVYCHDLKVDKAAANADVMVYGNVIASDDIEMNGNESDISLGGNFVGINSEAVDNDPNASSSIINNRATDGNSTITVNGNLIVPGRAYAEYDKDPSLKLEDIPDYYFRDDKNIYYPTVESVTAKNQDTFEYYLYTDNGSFIVFYVNGVKYYLKELSNVSFENQLSDFTSAGSSFNPISSRIFIRQYDELNGYSLGVVISDASLGGADAGKPVDLKNIISVSYGANENNFKKASANGQLKNVQDAKTKHFGYYDAGLDMRGLVSASDGKVYYFNGFTKDTTAYSSGTINITGDMNGIIYSTTDLTLTGDGTFSGVILCEGNITVNGNVKIVYSEDVINGIISNSKSLAARAFFKPGCDYGKANGSQTYAYYEDYDSTSGIKTETKRYRIESWLEGTE
jgi:hypothetical protein